MEVHFLLVLLSLSGLLLSAVAVEGIRGENMLCMHVIIHECSHSRAIALAVSLQLLMALILDVFMH